MYKQYWSDSAINSLINKVKSIEYLWNSKHILYKNKNQKQLDWINVVDELNKSFGSKGKVSLAETVKKWNNLKSYFTAEQRKLLRTKESVVFVTDSLETIESESTWKFFEKLKFLSENVEPDPMNSVNNCNKRSLSDLKNEDMSEIGHYPIDVGYDPDFSLSDLDDNKSVSSGNISRNYSKSENTPKKPRKEKITELTQVSDALLKSSQDLVNIIKTHVETKKVNGEQDFGQYIAKELAELKPEFRFEAKSKIFNIIIEMQKKQFELQP